MIDDWAKILDNQGQVDTFKLDFEKAFDTPLMNFSKANCLAMELGKNYEMDRCLIVFQATESCCKWSLIRLGPRCVRCPAGHRSWSLLFSLHINDIMSDIESEIRLFADDCVSYRDIKDIEDTLKLQKDIDRLGIWAGNGV